jgi:hypothetical protein
VRLQRVPEDLRLRLNPNAQARMLNPAEVEIRFVAASPTVRVTLNVPEGGTTVQPFWGLFQGRERHVVKGLQTLELTYPEKVADIASEWTDGMRPHPRVWRLMLRGGVAHFVGVEGEGVRPPTAEELPELTYLAYGTSITHGAAATGAHLTYPAQVARRLGANLVNLGVGGAAQCEKPLADYVAARRDWQVASLALSVNMIGAGFDPAGFRDRVTYWVHTVAGSDPARPVACITLYPHFRDCCPGFSQSPNWHIKPDECRAILREAVASCPTDNAFLVEGPDMLDLGGLSDDLIHPADHGMIQMGEVLARELRARLGV